MTITKKRNAAMFLAALMIALLCMILAAHTPIITPPMPIPQPPLIPPLPTLRSLSVSPTAQALR